MINTLNYDQQKINYSSYQVTDKLGNQSEGLKLTGDNTIITLKGNKAEIIHKTIELEAKRSLNITMPGVDLSFMNVSLKATYTKTTLPVDPSLDMDYWGADKTSSRIADLASSMAELWKISNPDKSKAEYENFLKTLKDSVGQGFAAAGKILDGVSNGPVQDLIQNTYDKTMSKIDKAFAEKRDHFA